MMLISKVARLFCVLLFLSACTLEPTRLPQSTWSVPTPAQLFLNGQFLVRPNLYNIGAENHYGEPLDLSSHRPAVDLSGTIFESKYGRPGTHLYANFYHRGQFWIVRVPDHGVSNVAFELVFFPPTVAGKDIAAHNFLRFDFAPGKELEIVSPMLDEKELNELAGMKFDDAMAKMAPELTGPQYKLSNIAISAEATWTQDDPKKIYDFVRGARGAFVIVSRFISMEVRFQEFYGDGGDPVQQFRYPLKHTDDGDKILHAGLQISQENGISKMYNTLTYNCATISFETVQRGTGAVDKRFGIIRKAIEKNYPILNARPIEAIGGRKATDMSLDPTLLGPSQAAYQSEIVAKQVPLCGPSIDARHCGYLKAAVEALKKGK